MDMLPYHCPSYPEPEPYMLAAWEKLNRDTLVTSNEFSFYEFERIGTDAILCKGKYRVATKGKKGWKLDGPVIPVVVTRTEINDFLARQTGPALTLKDAENRVRAQAELLVKTANELGVVVTIENRPTVPLAMGRYEMVLDIRPRRA
ncbi:hypothetical protein PJWF_00057 [Achromobacter phage JWF]|uniref:hypothetical protein n=1 Tax=Achromobacter phage JWF TaxID=1589748 RepID=UPI000588DFD0|nr:hypothetical protein AXJ13_gp057 [Achromobacter phage JWF]AJD82951.1 hypothetical protein PJWF_00057 [Achromobacter phage JWF]